MIGNVAEFHMKFRLPDGSVDLMTENQSPEIRQFRINFMQEELDEFVHAISHSDRVKAFDALLDLAYVVYGTALFMGVTPTQWHAGMHAVHAANMSKIRAERPGDSKRCTTWDVVKPAGWVGPEDRLKEILAWTEEAKL